VSDRVRSVTVQTSGLHVLDRPFYFIVVLWGDCFRDYFLDLCLPTLLSPRNLPSLATRQRSKFLICTRPDDWEAIENSPIFRLLTQYVDPVYLEIPPRPAGVQACVHMGIGHRRACEMAQRDRAYAFVLTPDTIFADGMIERLQELAGQGIELALVTALRFAEEPLFSQLQQLGIAPHARNGVAEPIVINSRQLVYASLASMHSETMAYEWEAAYFHSLPYAAWWRVPGEDGIVVHSMSWGPFLFDFAAVRDHDTSTFDEWTIDGDYVFRNLGHITRIHLVLDSDEMFLASWAPLADRPYDLRPNSLLSGPLGAIIKRAVLRSAFYSGVFDPLKQDIFFKGVRWHSKPINENWAPIEYRALATLLSCVAPPSGLESALDTVALRHGWSQRQVGWLRVRLLCWRPLIKLLIVPTRCILVARSLNTNREAICRRVIQMLRADPVAWKRAIWRVRQTMYKLFGRQFHEPEPRA